MENSIVKKPQWLRKKINYSSHNEMLKLLDKAKLHTVCQEAMCPNITECFKNKNATFLIMGDICTRHCSFCNVTKGKPGELDINEPANIVEAVRELGLRYVVITSPTRDDLQDGGAEHFCQTVEAIKSFDPSIGVEILIPDMKGDKEAIEKISQSKADVIAHNIETVPRLYGVRKGADYKRSLELLKLLKTHNKNNTTKSGIMLGLGEKDDEVKKVMGELLNCGCDFLSIGQYLSPSKAHEKVVEFIRPEKFEQLRQTALGMGFKSVKSSPYTRSSYMAHEYYKSEGI